MVYILLLLRSFCIALSCIFPARSGTFAVMRVSISTAIVLASLHTTLAQDATSTARSSHPSLTAETLPSATTITPEELAENSSRLASESTYAASLSSRIGTYRVRESWTDLPFFRLGQWRVFERDWERWSGWRDGHLRGLDEG